MSPVSHPRAPGPIPLPPGAGRVALVHHWLVRPRGGERVLAALSRCFPGSDLYTLVHDQARCPAPSDVAAVTTSALQRLPLANRSYRALLPLLPRFYRAMDLRGHSLVVSSDASLAKTVTVPVGARHLCYCYSPARYAWDLEDLYLDRSVPRWLHRPARTLLGGVRRADWLAARKVDRFVAVSHHAAQRIVAAYERPCDVVHPPVDTTFFTPEEESAAPAEPRPYLLLGEAVAYKRFDVAVRSCRELDLPLVVAGSGPHFSALRHLAGPRTRFVASPTDEDVRSLYRGCRALLFPGEEDFGLVPVEAMACGRPVIALARGGALETVQDGVTGVLYPSGPDGEVEALVAALQRFESAERIWTSSACRARAETFGEAAFAERLSAVLATMMLRPPLSLGRPEPSRGREIPSGS